MQRVSWGSQRTFTPTYALMRGGQAVQNVALDVGYESGSQFSREFKRYFGYNPQAVKKS